MKTRVFYTEAAYAVGTLLLALGTALTAYGGFGISMVVAPAYLLHLKLVQLLPFFSFGAAEYALQALVILVLILTVRKVRSVYFLSFAAALGYGVILDLCMTLTGLLPESLPLRIGSYALGVVLCTGGIALLFRSYLPPAAYELFVKELARKLRKPISAVKTVYDCVSLVVALLMSLVFFGGIEGIGIGTVVCALIYGTVIRKFSDLFDKIYVFRDAFSLRTQFEESEETI